MTADSLSHLLPWVLGAAVLSLLGTGAARRYAVRRALLDIPNRRSSHERPTPKGGGISVAVVSLGAVLLALLLGALPARLAWAVLGGGGAIAAVGWIDDRRHVSPGIRIVIQAAAAAWALLWIGAVPVVGVGALQVPLGPWSLPLGVLVVVGITNFYNFMDGIDGIAAAEAVLVCLALVLLSRDGGGWTVLPSVLGASAFGFLLWNWDPARIFMGDVGSGFIGFVLAVSAFWSEAAGAVPLVVVLGFLGLFLLDPTVTLLRRVLGRERWWKAHRKHAYQRAVRAGLSHGRVTALVVGLNAFFGLSLAIGAGRGFLIEAALLILLVWGFLYWALERIEPMPVGRDR